MRLALLALVGCTAAQAVLLPPFSLGGIRPDLFLLLVLLLSPRLTPEGAAVQGFCIGLVQDSLSGGPVGLCAFIFSLMGFLAARLSRDVYIDKPLAQLWLLLAASGASGVLTYALLAFFLGPPPVLMSVQVILPEALYTALFGVVLLRLPPVRAVLARAS
jgi:rod shape-determining protein MreD